MNIAHDLLRCLGPILDFSSVDHDSFFYTLLSRQRPINSALITCISALRRNSPLFFKEEMGCNALSAIFGLSPKQYAVLRHSHLTIPLLTPNPVSSFSNHEVCTSNCTQNLIPLHERNVVRIKGIKRSIQDKLLTTQDFQRSAERGCPPKRVKQHSLIRRDRKIFLVSQTKRSFSLFCNKSYFDPRYSNASHYFSFPLYMKSLLES